MFSPVRPYRRVSCVSNRQYIVGLCFIYSALKWETYIIHAQSFIKEIYRDTWVPEIDLFYDFGKNGHVCICTGNIGQFSHFKVSHLQCDVHGKSHFTLAVLCFFSCFKCSVSYVYCVPFLIPHPCGLVTLGSKN